MSTDDDLNELIIAAAATTSAPRVSTLKDLYSLVSAAGVAESLDALRILSVLLPLNDPAARDLIAIMGECSSAKEVIMAAQEEVERIADPIENIENGGEGPDITETTSCVDRLIEVIDLYRAAIPRFKLRKRLASETLQPLLSDLRRAMEVVSSQVGFSEGLTLMTAVGSMVDHVLKWVKGIPAIEPEETTKCQALLRSTLDYSLVSFRHMLRYDTSQMALEVCFPRLRIVGRTVDSDNVEGSQIIEQYLSIYNDLGYSLGELASSPSLVSVIALVHTRLTTSSPALGAMLPTFLPTLLPMLQPTSNLQNHAIAFLLLSLCQHQNLIRTELSPDNTCTLVPPLVVLSSAHPSPSTRHQSFRSLTLLLASSVPQLRFQLLADLVAKCEYPQMRVAAVSLIKDAVLEALSVNPPNSTSAFGTPMFMRVFGPLLFRPSPPDLFDQGETLDIGDFSESQEPKRIMEVLSLYYVVLSRDKANMTSIRDRDMMGTVEKNFLNPLETWLETVLERTQTSGNHDHTMMPLALLRTGLNRAREANANL